MLPFERLSHYRLLSRLGTGGMGEVYLAEDTRLDRRVAIKVLPEAFSTDPDRVRRFLIEAKAASALNHPHIITVYDIGEGAPGRFLVMEAVEGRTLRLAMENGCSVADLVGWGSQMAKGLMAAHAAGITHRDIKPENIMVRPDGYVKILDFGLARLGGTVETTTEPGILMGTLRYMSPEQARGDVATSASDVYSLGMVFFEMATGRYPFATNTFMAVLHSILVEPAGAPSSFNPSLSPELDALICRMLDKDPAARPTAAEVAAQLTAPVDGNAPAPLVAMRASGPERHTVGRQRERDELLAAIAGVNRGRGLLYCVSGEPGIGKSTLVEEFLGMVAADGACTIARGRCSERLAGTEAYLPVLGALANLLQSSSQIGIGRLMQELAPAWYAQVATASRDAALAASQDRMKRELGTFLAAVAKTRPLLLFFDDLHWADLSTVDVLSYLASQFDGLRILVVVTYRPSDMLLAKHPFLQINLDLQARGLLRELPLSFLSVEEIGQYLQLEFPGHHFPAGLAQLIYEKTEGSPLFMADLVRYLRDRGVIAEGRDGWLVAKALPEVELALPESVRGMIDRKIGQLSEDDRGLLGVASVQGYEFDSAVLSEVLSLDAETVEDRLEALDRIHGLVRMVREGEFPTRQISVRYRFIHVLYQNALFNALRATRRSRMSGSVAAALERFSGERRNSIANELAVLWERAREFEKAAQYFLIAARQASHVFADQEAAVLARRGLDALENVPGSHDAELALLVVAGVALRAVKGFADPEVGKVFERARDLTAVSAPSARLVPVLRGLWEYYEVQADYGRALPCARQLLELATDLNDPGLVVVGCDVMGDTCVWLGDFSQGWTHLSHGVDLYDAQAHRSHVFVYGYDTGMACYSYGAIALWHLGESERAAAHMRKAAGIAAEMQHPMTSAFAAIMGGWLYRLMGDFPLAMQESERAVAISTEHGLPYFLGFGRMTLGWAWVGVGRLTEGVAEIEHGLSIYRSSGSALGNTLWLGTLAEGYWLAGRKDEARAALQQAMGIMDRTGERVYASSLMRLQGMMGE